MRVDFNSSECRNLAEQAESWPQAQAALQELWQQRTAPATAAFVVSCAERFRPQPYWVSMRLGILRSFTVEPLIPMLRAGAFLGGIDLTVRAGDFNAYSQEILDPASWIYRNSLDAVILAVQTCDISPELWERYSELTAGERESEIARVVESFRNWVSVFRSRSKAALILHGLECPAFASDGVLDGVSSHGQADAIRQINRELRAIAAENAGVYVLDYDAVIARCGRNRWFDEVKWMLVRLPMRAEHFRDLTSEWLRFLHPLSGRIAKVLVTDLDNTLWGGIVSEDGVERLQAGVEGPGAAFRQLQRAILDLSRRGILLAVASKNNADEALEALDRHPGMLLRSKNFAALQMNWNDKTASLREIARQLNVGTDSLVFLDDNPAERQRVRLEMPEVMVIELPAHPVGYANALRDCPMFERLVLSEEDRRRGELYIVQRERQSFEEQAGSLEEFYQSLGQQVMIAPMTADTLPRAAQLLLKTNQFNLTTHRYKQTEIATFAAASGCDVYTINVRDRFGDNGLVGVVMTQRTGDACLIDVFLLSCRVIGRTVETAVMAFLAEKNRSRGVARLEGWFLPTRKNAPAEGFYRNHGFRLVQQKQDGSTLWSLNLNETVPACPSWIEMNMVKESAA